MEKYLKNLAFDFERALFHFVVGIYLWWFYSSSKRRVIRVMSNICLLVYFSATLFCGVKFAAVILAQNRDGEIIPYRDLIIQNTHSLQELERKQLGTIALQSELLKDLADMKIRMALREQELNAYRWAIGVIYIAMVAQLGAWIFSSVLSRQFRKDLNIEEVIRKRIEKEYKPEKD